MKQKSFPAPRVDDSAWVAPTAFVSGDVTLEAQVSVWPSASIRGDMEPIHLARGANVQDGAVLHTSYGFPMQIEQKVTIGHAAVVHSATRVGEGTLVGMNATVLDGAEVGKGCLIAAGAVVTPGTKVPDHSLVAGIPGKVVRTDENLYEMNMENYRSYLELGEQYKKGKWPVHRPG